MVEASRTAALEAVRGFLATCYPGWSGQAIAAESGGGEFLAAREAVEAALRGEADAYAALASAAPIVKDSFPAADIGDEELDGTMGEEIASALRGARDALLGTFDASSLDAVGETRGPRR